jgi:hypothetical protein
VKKFGFSTSENWLLDMSGFEKNDGFIRIEYRKIKTWQVYDSTISWFQETCGHLKKVSR